MSRATDKVVAQQRKIQAEQSRRDKAANESSSQSEDGAVQAGTREIRTVVVIALGARRQNELTAVTVSLRVDVRVDEHAARWR